MAHDSAPATRTTTASAGHKPLVPAPQVRRLPASQPEIVIEVPPPPHRHRWMVWFAAGLLLVLLVLAVIWGTTMRRQQNDIPGLEATLEALVAARLAAQGTDAGLQPTPPDPIQLSDGTMPTAAASAADVNASATVSTQPQADSRGADSAAIFARPAVDILNIRTGPGEAYPVLGSLNRETRLHLLGRTEDGRWLAVTTDGGENTRGWVAAWLLDLVGDPNGLTVFSAPPVPTELPTPQPTTQVRPTATALPPTPSAVVAAAAPEEESVDQPSTSCATEGVIRLQEPVEQAVHDQATFRWHFSGALLQGCGFEVTLWQDGEEPRGIHDAVRDYHEGNVKLTRANEYRLTVPFLHALPSVQGRAGNFYWTVTLVQIEPAYAPTSISAPPAWFYVNGRD